MIIDQLTVKALVVLSLARILVWRRAIGKAKRRWSGCRGNDSFGQWERSLAQPKMNLDGIGKSRPPSPVRQECGIHHSRSNCVFPRRHLVQARFLQRHCDGHDARALTADAVGAKAACATTACGVCLLAMQDHPDQCSAEHRVAAGDWRCVWDFS
jgi:hypothetical protein